MEIPVPVLLVAVAGLAFLAGTRIGASRTLRLIRQGRFLRASSSRVGRFMADTPPTRSAADILAGRIRLQFGGQVYELPVLPRSASRKWLESLDASFISLSAALDEAGDDGAQILALLSTQTDLMYDALLAYDTTNVLPARDELDDVATDAEVLHAVLEVWRAANPLLATVAANSPSTSGTSPVPPSSQPTPTVGVPMNSGSGPTNSWSSTSTPPRSASSSTRRPASRKPSKPSGSGPSSPTTGKRSIAGATALASVPGPRGRA